MLKTTSLLCGSKAITIAVSIIRTKTLALILGPSGIGFLGVLNASIELARVLFSFGLGAATVRNIAQNHTDRVALNRLYRISQWTGIVLGAVSGLIFGLISPYLWNHFFGDSSKIWCFLVGAGCLLSMGRATMAIIALVVILCLVIRKKLLLWRDFFVFCISDRRRTNSLRDG
jgi:O-antigen/teichoic acid export membrane protein